MKKVISIFLLLSILMSGVAVLGEQTSPTQPSIIISALTSPTGVELPEGFVIELLTPSETAQKVFDEIAEFVKDKTASEYFGEEAMTAAAAYLPEETEIAIRTSAGRLLLVGTAQIAAKTTKDSAGVAVITLKKNQHISELTLAEKLELADPHRYRVRSLPAAGAILRQEDSTEQMSLL